MRHFWPASEASQLDYEVLRSAALEGAPLSDERAVRFEKSGLAGLIAKPCSNPHFEASLVGAERPRWTPYHDPREAALSACFEYLLGVADIEVILLQEACGCESRYMLESQQSGKNPEVRSVHNWRSSGSGHMMTVMK